MPELGPYGSVRGARGNSRPYRESRRGPAKPTRMTRMRHHASFMMRAVPETLIELPAISLISARISDRIPMSSP